MGVIIFLTAAIIEASIAAVSIYTKTNQVKVRSIIRITTFSGFMILVMLPVIDWSFRYYALATFLLTLSIIGAINLIFEKEEKREYKTINIVFKAIGMMVLFFALTLPAIIFPQNKPLMEATGEYLVSTKTYTYIDKNRVESYTDTGENRKLNVQFWYPISFEGTYPLIIFSHGGLGVKSSNETLFKELASHGYLVCSIDHTYHSFYTTDEDGETTLIDLGYIQELFAENPRTDIQQSYEYYKKWMNIRTEDIGFVIDYIISEAEDKNENSLYSLVDTSKIGVMGHSLGGSAALGTGRVRDDISAVITLESPFMYDIEGVEDGRFIFTDETYPVPVLNVYSDSAWHILSDRPQYATNYALLTDTDSTAFNVYIKGVGHLGLTDFALTSPLLTRVLDGQKSTKEAEDYLKTINKVCLEFYNSYLKGEGVFTSNGMH
jgi:dienelactone hydrolase